MTTFDNDRDSCACGQVILDLAAPFDDQGEATDDGLVHGPIVCVRRGPGD